MQYPLVAPTLHTYMQPTTFEVATSIILTAAQIPVISIRGIGLSG